MFSKKFQSVCAIVGGLCALGVAGSSASAQVRCVDFESQPVGATWGSVVGDAPGVFMFNENGIDVVAKEFTLGTFTGFVSARVEPSPTPGCLTGNTLRYNNISSRYDFSGLPGVVTQVTFDYLDLGGDENISVNGSPTYEGDIRFTPNFGPITTTVTGTPVAGGVCGTVTFSGPSITSICIGGQELWVDNVCAEFGQITQPCTDGVDFETEPLGMAWGNAFGDVPGSVIFTQNGADVSIKEFRIPPAFVAFNEARIVTALGPACLNNQVMNLNNINLGLDLTNLGAQVTFVEFDYLDQGGTENFTVNGLPLYIGELSAVPNPFGPGITINVTTSPTPNGTCGHVEIFGPIDTLCVGGQEFFVDNFCWELGQPDPCDALVDVESRALGEAWGSPHGDLPGAFAFNEAGVDVNVKELVAPSGLILFNEMVVTPPPVPCLSGNTLQLNNIQAGFRFNGLTGTTQRVRRVTFDFIDLGGFENFSANGFPLYIGDLEFLPAMPAPGVQSNVTVTPIPGGICGTVELRGCLNNICVGGQEFWLDNLCVELGCLCDWDGDGVVLIGDLLAYLANWFALNPIADIDCDGAVGITDLLAFLSCWFATNGGACP